MLVVTHSPINAFAYFPWPLTLGAAEEVWGVGVVLCLCSLPLSPQSGRGFYHLITVCGREPSRKSVLGMVLGTAAKSEKVIFCGKALNQEVFSILVIT